MSNMFDLIADDSNLISYRPALNKITGSVTSSILLQQMMFYWKLQKRKPFYKFKEPCEHRLYKENDSWLEKLGFTRREFDSALKKIGIKIAKTTKGTEHDKFIEYWVTSDRITYYQIHLENLEKSLNSLYEKHNSAVSVKHNSAFTKSTIPPLLYAESTAESESSLDSEKVFPDKMSSSVEYINFDSVATEKLLLRQPETFQKFVHSFCKAFYKYYDSKSRYFYREIDHKGALYLEKNFPDIFKFIVAKNAFAYLPKYVEEEIDDGNFKDYKTGKILPFEFWLFTRVEKRLKHFLNYVEDEIQQEADYQYEEYKGE